MATKTKHPRQFRNAGPMVLHSPCDYDLQILRDAVLRTGRDKKTRITQLAFFFSDDETLHVYAKAYNKLSEAMWRQYVHLELKSIQPIEGSSFKNAIRDACQDRVGQRFEEYTHKSNSLVAPCKDTEDHQKKQANTLTVAPEPVESDVQTMLREAFLSARRSFLNTLETFCLAVTNIQHMTVMHDYE